MTNKGFKKYNLTVYGLYDKNENIVFTGNIWQCSEYCQKNPKTLRTAVHKGNKIGGKYFIKNLGFKETFFPEYKICTKCGKIKPISDFRYLKCNNAYYAKCISCEKLKGSE